jgi:Arc/MetJ-type ribon-helix-helix transcriptional regulator
MPDRSVQLTPAQADAIGRLMALGLYATMADLLDAALAALVAQHQPAATVPADPIRPDGVEREDYIALDPSSL